MAAVVVNYNAADQLGACLAVLAANGVEQVVVVDNGSADGSERWSEATGARWLPTGANLGYGRAANRGAATPDARAARYLLVCNPDVELGPGAVAALVSALDADPTLGIVGPRALTPTAPSIPRPVRSRHGRRRRPRAARHGPPGNPFTRRYRLLDWDHRERPGWTGCRAHASWSGGRRGMRSSGFDPAYFMYMEDVDLCWRLDRAGWAVGYEPAAEVSHVQGVSTDQHPYRMLVAHHRSLWRFAWRTTDGPQAGHLPVVAEGLAARLAVATSSTGWAAPPARRSDREGPERRRH